MLFVGEGDFTFTLAFAALRKYRWLSCPMKQDDWQGIMSTRYEHTPEISVDFLTHQFGSFLFGDNPVPDPKSVRKTCIQYLSGVNRSDKLPKHLFSLRPSKPPENHSRIPTWRMLLWYRCP